MPFTAEKIPWAGEGTRFPLVGCFPRGISRRIWIGRSLELLSLFTSLVVGFSCVVLKYLHDSVGICFFFIVCNDCSASLGGADCRSKPASLSLSTFSPLGTIAHAAVWYSSPTIFSRVPPFCHSKVHLSFIHSLSLFRYYTGFYFLVFGLNITTRLTQNYLNHLDSSVYHTLLFSSSAFIWLYSFSACTFVSFSLELVKSCFGKKDIFATHFEFLLIFRGFLWSVF